MSRPTEPAERKLQRICWVALIASLAFVLYGSLVPFDFVRPFAWQRVMRMFERSLRPRWFSKTDFLANILLGIPIGFFGVGALVGRRAGWVRRSLSIPALLILTFALSLTVETLQTMLPQRTPSLFDVTAQVVGATCGIATWPLLRRRVNWWVTNWSVNTRTSLISKWLSLYVLLRAALILWPMDLTLDLGLLAHKLRDGIIFNPFQSPIWQAASFTVLMRAVLLAAPIGMWTSVVGVSNGARRSILAGALLGVAFFAALEAVQILIVSCRPDAGEFLLNAVGGVIGACISPALAGGSRFSGGPP